MGRRQKGCDILQFQSGFGIFRGDIHLQVAAKRVTHAPPRQLLSHLDAIQGVKGEGHLGHVLRLVLLQGANRVPMNAGHIAQLLRLFPQLLRVVFPEVALAGLAGRPDARCGMQLGNGDQRHRVGGAIGPSTRRRNPAMDRLPIAAYAFD